MNNIITMRWIEIIILSSVTVMMYSNIHAYSRCTDAECCHASSQPYHYHDGGDSLSGSTGNGKLSEDAYDLLLYNSIGDGTETQRSYTHSDKSSYVRIDCKIEGAVYERGPNKQSSLDNIQQTLFFSNLTGKKPVAVI